MPPSKSHRNSPPVPVTVQLAYNLTKNRQVGYNMALSWVKDAIRDLKLPLVVSDEVIHKIIGYYDEHSLQKITRR